MELITNNLRICLVCTLLFVFGSLSCMGQSKQLYNVYNGINRLFQEYEFQSENDSYISSDTYYTHNIQLSFTYPTIKIEYTESYRNGGLWCSGEQEGKHAILLDVNATEISFKYRRVEFSSSSGIETVYKGKKSICDKTFITSDKYTAQKLCDELRKLQSLIIEENFCGKLGSTSVAKKKTLQTKGHKATPIKNQKTKSGKYGQ